MKMKKKLAALLAVTMVLSPLTVFGATDNKLTKTPTNVVGKTLFMEEGYNNSGMLNLKVLGKESDDIEYVVDGTTAIAEVINQDINTNDTFKVTLENAKWFFRNNSNITIASARKVILAGFIDANIAIEITSVSGGLVTGVKFVNSKNALNDGLSAELIKELEALVADATTAKLTALYTAMDAHYTAITVVPAVGDYLELLDAAGARLTAATMTAVSNAVTGVWTPAGTFAVPQATSDFASGHDMMGEIANKTNPYATTHNPSMATGAASTQFSAGGMSTYNASYGLYLPNSRTFFRFEDDTSTAGITYHMTMSYTNDSTGTIKMVEPKGIGNELFVPLVSLSKAEGDIRVRIANESNTTSLTTLHLQYGQAAKNNTATTVKTEVVSKYNFLMDQLIIAEKVPNSLQAGGIILQAPYGYTFVDPEKAYKEDGKDKWVTAYGEESLFFKNNVTKAENTKTLGSFIRYAYDQNDNQVKDKIVIDAKMLGLLNTGKTNGKLVIEGLQLTASDYASMDDDIKITIRDVDTDSNSEDGRDRVLGKAYVTKEDFKIGTRKEWGVVLERIGDIPTLINGRYNEALKGTEFDKDHKAAKVKLTENVVASWWGLRESQFTLSEGARWIQAKVAEVKNIDDTIDGTFTPNKEQTNAHIRMDATKLRFVDVEIKKDKKSSFEIESWISIESGVEGDIEMIAGGNDILTNETKPVVIAKAVSPITIESKVTDVKIGYQWQKAHDIVIKENGPGYLKRDKDVVLLIDDNITGSDRIAFAPDFVVETNGTTSKMEINKPIVNGGNIEFSIERISNGKAAELKFSNVYVKIDRTVPESNKKPYNIVAGGTAIAANYYENQGEKRIDSYKPFFGTKGIGVEYLNVVTSANDKDSILSNVVRLEIGSDIVKIGRNGEKEIKMDTAPYISPQTNSTMIPVRYVAIALGIAEDQISWDSIARKVTITNGSRIVQFEIGNSEIIINGVSKTMYSPDVPPIKVVPEIKDDRAFLPFRELGNAFGVGNVHWDEPTQAAIYNYNLDDNPVDDTK